MALLQRSQLFITVHSYDDPAIRLLTEQKHWAEAKGTCGIDTKFWRTSYITFRNRRRAPPVNIRWPLYSDLMAQTVVHGHVSPPNIPRVDQAVAALPMRRGLLWLFCGRQSGSVATNDSNIYLWSLSFFFLLCAKGIKTVKSFRNKKKSIIIKGGGWWRKKFSHETGVESMQAHKYLFELVYMP